jgi:dipeptidyl-peptidase-4
VFDRGGRFIGRIPAARATPLRPPAPEYRKLGQQGIWSYVLRPRDARPGQRLPTIVSVYGGPHVNHVESSARSLLSEQWLADQGFLVVGFDNRGTPRRGREWERAIRGNFAGVVLEDQVAALQLLAQQVPEVDLSRVGITGWSFGGYAAALAVLKRPDVFKAAVAGAPATDWRNYDTFFTERYLGSPDAPGDVYEKNSLLPLAPGLRRLLLLVYGTADDNVYFLPAPASDALFAPGGPTSFPSGLPTWWPTRQCRNAVPQSRDFFHTHHARLPAEGDAPSESRQRARNQKPRITPGPHPPSTSAPLRGRTFCRRPFGPR